MRKSFGVCPLCGGKPKGLAFPYRIRYQDNLFHYVRCCQCATVYVSPVPDAITFESMYAPEAYHDLHYGLDVDLLAYQKSISLLNTFALPGCGILDFGCGAGHFLLACRLQGFRCFGVEFSRDAARAAAQCSGVAVVSVADWLSSDSVMLFDAIHLGDVLEHLPDPAGTLKQLLAALKPNGLLFFEGPLEENASLVLWASRSVGRLNRFLRPTLVGEGVPTHLFRTHSKAQKAFFNRLIPHAIELYWELDESGWPYASGGRVKRMIASLARRVSLVPVIGSMFGNRFRLILRVP